MDGTLEALAHDEVDAAAARDAVWRALDGPAGFREAYAALCRWTWRVMIERRLDDELRSWHRLLLDAAAKLAGLGSLDEVRTRARPRLDPAAAAERIRALADVVRLSVEAAAASVPAELGRRAHVLEILRHLAESGGEHVDREPIRRALGLGDANLSRILTLMTANGLVERLPRGKVASFRITRRGLALVTAADPRERESARAEMPPLHIPLPGPDHPKTARFVPGTVVKLGVGGLVAHREILGPVDHEPTYPPLKVAREVVSGTGGGRRLTRARERELAL